VISRPSSSKRAQEVGIPRGILDGTYRGPTRARARRGAVDSGYAVFKAHDRARPAHLPSIDNWQVSLRKNSAVAAWNVLGKQRGDTPFVFVTHIGRSEGFSVFALSSTEFYRSTDR